MSKNQKTKDSDSGNVNDFTQDNTIINSEFSKSSISIEDKNPQTTSAAPRKGRPRKTPVPVENEQKTMVTMAEGNKVVFGNIEEYNNTQNHNQNVQSTQSFNAKNMVDNQGLNLNSNYTTDSMSNSISSTSGSNTKDMSELDKLAMYAAEEVKQRWASVFSKYEGMSADSIAALWRVGNGGYNGLTNPFIQNKRVKQINSSPLKLSKDLLEKAVADPESNEEVLRGTSAWLSYSNYIYQMLIQLNRDTSKYFYYATPLYLKGGDNSKDNELEDHKYLFSSKFSKEKLKEDSKRVDQILKAFNVNSTFKDIATQVALEGKCTYLIRTSYDANHVNYIVLQKLNSHNVKITGFGSKQKFIISFNMAIFLEPGYSPSQYPTFIQETWDEMLNLHIVHRNKKGSMILDPNHVLPEGHSIESIVDGKYMYWVQLPQDLAITFYSNGAHPNAFPDTLGLFNDLVALDDWRWYQGQIASQSVNSVLTAEVPYEKNARAGSDSTLASTDNILGFTDLFNQTIGGSVWPFFAPFTNFKLHSVETNPDSLNVVYDRLKDLMATSGNSALLPITEKPSISATNTARMLQEAKSDYLTRQFESFLNMMINDNFNLHYNWHITVHGGLFNYREDAKSVKELVLAGHTGLFPRLLSYYDTSLEDYEGSKAYMEAMGIKIGADANLERDLEQLEKTAKVNAAINKKYPTDNTSGDSNNATNATDINKTSSNSNDSNDSNNSNGSNNGEIETGETKKVGRPSANQQTIESDSTGTSIDMGNNVSEIKKYIADAIVGNFDEFDEEDLAEFFEEEGEE